MELAGRLESDPRIVRVRYPGLPSHSTHEAAKSFMTGFGAMLSFETDGDADRCDAMLHRLELVNHATSLGGVETTVERRASLPGQQRIPPTLVRMSVGCESVDDLWADLDQALA
jgi:cystathionine gamma-synthase